MPTCLLPRVPLSCFWEITEACNLRCVHCEASAGLPLPDELDTREALDTVNQLADLGCESLYLTGGEPLVRPDWVQIASHARECGMTVSVISNGVLVNSETIGTLQDAGVHGLSISLDGLRDTHERIRLPAHPSVRSSYQAAIDAIRLGVRSRLQVAVITLIHRQNLGRLSAIHDLLVALGVVVWQVQICMPLGRMRHHQSSLLIEPADLPELEWELAGLIEREQLRIAVGDNIGYYGPEEPSLRGSVRGMKSFWLGCFAGCRLIALCANGDVKGCPSHPRELVCGNLRHSSLAEIWHDCSRFSYNTQWDASKLGGACRTCPHRNLCRAGCTTMALATSGSVYENPYCSLAARASTRAASG